MFIGELSVLDNSPFWHFDDKFRKQSISNPNLKREQNIGKPKRIHISFFQVSGFASQALF